MGLAPGKDSVTPLAWAWYEEILALNIIFEYHKYDNWIKLAYDCTPFEKKITSSISWVYFSIVVWVKYPADWCIVCISFELQICYQYVCLVLYLQQYTWDSQEIHIDVKSTCLLIRWVYCFHTLYIFRGFNNTYKL